MLAKSKTTQTYTRYNRRIWNTNYYRNHYGTSWDYYNRCMLGIAMRMVRKDYKSRITTCGSVFLYII
jgi:hypothetical protein